MRMSESIIEISKALSKFQEQVEQPLKNADNPFFKSKYVPLENVVEAISKCGPKNGLSFVQWPSNDESGRVGVATLLMHSSGEFIEFDPVFMNADKQTAQGAGSLISYLKRYSLSAIYGITSDVDDDGNNASGSSDKQQKQNYSQAPKKASDKQIKMIHAKSNEYVKARGEGKVDDVTDALKKKVSIDTLTDATSSQASAMIKQLDAWLDVASKKEA